uniref:Fibronectin type-III domain-containing protein n=1 Tax=Heterorhabditis bacteriophora TaxID=37862 RepID=A0A1I7W9A8_HETBA
MIYIYIYFFFNFDTKQTNPDTLSGHLYAEPISATGISLSWTPLHTAQWNGQAKGYLVIYREAGEEGWVR